MSAPSAEGAAGARRESALGVAAVAGGLILIAAAEQFRGSFAVQGVPPGWSVTLAQAVPDSFFNFHSELRIVRLQREGSAPEPDPVPAPDAKPEWKKLPESAPLGEPVRLHVAWYDPSSGNQDVQRQLDSHGAVELGMLGEKGGKVRVDAG